jgi:hypothetical protein
LALVDFAIVASAPTLALITYCRSTSLLLNESSEIHSIYTITIRSPACFCNT